MYWFSLSGCIPRVHCSPDTHTQRHANSLLSFTWYQGHRHKETDTARECLVLLYLTLCSYSLQITAHNKRLWWRNRPLHWRKSRPWPIRYTSGTKSRVCLLLFWSGCFAWWNISPSATSYQEPSQERLAAWNYHTLSLGCWSPRKLYHYRFTTMCHGVEGNLHNGWLAWASDRAACNILHWHFARYIYTCINIF